MNKFARRSREIMEYTPACERCEWHLYPMSRRRAEELGKRHEADCALAHDLGLEPILELPVYTNMHSRKVRGWRRVSDGAALEIHECVKKQFKYLLSWPEAHRAGYSQDEFLAGQAWELRHKEVTELRLVIGDDYLHPIEVYVVPDDWNWRTHALPWEEGNE